MKKFATLLTLGAITTAVTALGFTAQAGLCDESVTQSKQSEVTANPDGSTTEATAEQTQINRSNPAPLPMPVAKTRVSTKVASKVSTRKTAYKPRVGTTTSTHVHVKVR